MQVTSAGVQDHHQLFDLLSLACQRTQRLKKVWVDAGYQSNDLARRASQDLGVDVEIVSRPEGSKGFVILPRRWVAERTFAWLGRYRRLSKEYEFEPQSSESMIYIAMSNLMLRRLAKIRREQVS